MMEPSTLTSEQPGPREPAGPVALPTYEYNLLRLARFVVGELPLDQASKLINQRITTPPPCVSGECGRLLQDILGKGVMLRLIRVGGWRVDRHLRRDEPVRGRVWERIPLAERRLEFSGAPLAFLMWLTQEKPQEIQSPLSWEEGTLTAADEVFFLMALDALQQLKDCYQPLVELPIFRQNPLCWLMHWPTVSLTDSPTPQRFQASFQGTRLAVLECFQTELTKRWIRSEREKTRVTNWNLMRQQGLAEHAVLGSYLTAANTADRWDLARFVLNSASAIVLNQPDLMPSYWVGNLRVGAPTRLSDRLETQRAALTLMRQMETLRQWTQRAKTVGHFDEGYQAKQLWKADWEAAQGDLVAALARKVLERLEPLRTH